MAPRKSRKTKQTLADLIDPAAEHATTSSEIGGVVGYEKIDAPLYSHSEANEAMMQMAAEHLGVTDEDLKIVEQVEALAEATSATSEPTPPATEDAPKSFDQVLSEIPEDKIEETVFATAAAFDERADFERTKNPDNENIHRTLKKARAQMVTKRAAKVMIACNVSPDRINRVFHEGSRYNVYALGKLADVIYGVTNDGAVSNAINLACMRSLFQFKKAGLQFTGELAKAAASDKVRVDASLRKHLISHTVSASTAPTQASSTMQALETLGVVRRSGSHKNPNFELTDHPIVRKLEDVVMPKAA